MLDVDDNGHGTNRFIRDRVLTRLLVNKLQDGDATRVISLAEWRLISKEMETHFSINPYGESVENA